MSIKLSALSFAVLLTVTPALGAPLDGEKTYDLLFKNGTLDQIDRKDQLVYDREVSNQLKPEAGERDTGQIAISFPADQDEMAHLEFRQNEKSRALGVFPATVGNPMIMFFYESVVRDMAESAGGSPFYIRNRVKEALTKPAEIEIGEAEVNGKLIETRTIKLYPFLGDPNQDRMRGFGSLELSVTMSEDIPGWYLSLVADTPQADAGAAVYRSEMRFDRLDEDATE